jgi:hypothetical protein
MKGPFSLKYLLTGAGKEDWFKSWGLGWRLLVTLSLIGLIFFSIYTIFHKQPNQTIIAKPGSNVSVTQINKQSRFFIPFIEAGVEQRTTQNMGTYIRAGVRIEF